MTAFLSLDSVSKRFGGLIAVDGISFDVREGEILGVIGPNGAGKSVLVNMISGFYAATSGAIRFRGRDITHLPAHQFGRLGIARTFQNIRTFQRMTVMENVMVAFGAHVRRPFASLFAARRQEDARRALDLLERMHLADKADDPANSLAYGEARRLEIARALASDPTLILFDEPAAGMNTVETEQLRADILRCRSDRLAIVVIEHDLELLRGISDRMIAIDYGRKIAEGAPDVVLSDARVVEAYLGGEEDD
ncbi:MAG: ABC transporter ATP-binding protein [Bradyrhizobium sp.]